MGENTKTPALSYDDLNNVATQLSQQNMALRKQMEEMNYYNLFKRLDYLFKVLEFKDQFPQEFVEAVSKEIVDMITPAEQADDVEQ